jgi:uncharacterized membrane protein
MPLKLMDKNHKNISISQNQAISLKKIMNALKKYWITIYLVLFGILLIMPFLAPFFMQIGLTSVGGLIYLFYSFLCHQLPERSFFMYGSQVMYSLEELQRAGADTGSLLSLREFIGTPELGWKVAWSDRMIWMYASMWLFGLLWKPFLSKIKALPWWGLVLFLFPMAVDGITHFISDLAGIGMGFRASNAWLAELSGYTLPASFYAGDALGSFNALMRLLTGFLFGLGVVWYAFPYVEMMLISPSEQPVENSNLTRYIKNLEGLKQYDNNQH